jgi:hypothetical protein
MRHICDEFRTGFVRASQKVQPLVASARSADGADAETRGIENPNDRSDATPESGLLVRGLNVDASLNTDCTVREFRIGRS